jgi:hypothetical protein
MKTEHDFHEWLYACGPTFTVGGVRYGQFPGLFVVVCDFSNREEVNQLVIDLEDSDIPALDAGNELAKLRNDGEIYLGYDDNPTEAMSMCVEMIRRYYYDDLNKGET